MSRFLPVVLEAVTEVGRSLESDAFRSRREPLENVMPDTPLKSRVSANKSGPEGLARAQISGPSWFQANLGTVEPRARTGRRPWFCCALATFTCCR